MILIGRGLNHEAGVSGGEGSTLSRKSTVEAEARSSVQVNSDCAVVKVRIKECQAERDSDACGESGGGERKFSNKAETGWTKAEG